MLAASSREGVLAADLTDQRPDPTTVPILSHLCVRPKVCSEVETSPLHVSFVQL